MKKIAIPLENGRLCSHFGHCQQFAIVDVENNSIIGEQLITHRHTNQVCSLVGLPNEA